jgi:GMP synthase (glutamine-hydrolysing)
MKPIVILDFGSQFAHLIGNRVRRLNAYSEVIPTDTSVKEIKKMNPAGIILSGGPESVFADDSPKPDPKIFELGIPMLGICYGHHLLAHHFGGEIKNLQKEYGEAQFTHLGGELFQDIPDTSTVWMNHGDSVIKLPKRFEGTGKTKDCPIASFADPESNIYSVQFHPEVTHSVYGMKILENFVRVCGTAGNWNIESVLKHLLSDIQQKVGEKNVFLLVSGGVDSSVAFALLSRALGDDRIFGLFVDHGLLRKNEAQEVQEMLSAAGFKNLHVAHESEYFLEKLNGLVEPEEKRKAIGNAFLDVQQKIAHKLELDSGDWLLGQGTIYPDHIETGGSKHASKIKTHHNRVPEIEEMLKKGLVIEPLADFYKDEVREIGLQLQLPEKMVQRHPFPGPGLGVRILCHRSAYPLSNAQEIENDIQKSFHLEASVLPIRSVGVQGDARSYGHPVALFTDSISEDLLDTATAIANQHAGINRVVVSLSHHVKPNSLTIKQPVEITKDRIQILQEADAKVRRILEQEHLMNEVWQFPVVLAPIGVLEDTESIVLRPIRSENAMTATAVLFPENILQRLSSEILDIPGISAVFLDITSKPPGTIEWE